MRRFVVLLALLAGLVLAPAVIASHGASLSLDQAAPAFGDQVTFTYDDGSFSGTPRFFVYVECSQGRMVVYGMYSDPLTQESGTTPPFTLGPTAWWTGGAAECAATLFYYDQNNRTHELATAGFAVAA